MRSTGLILCSGGMPKSRSTAWLVRIVNDAGDAQRSVTAQVAGFIASCGAMLLYGAAAIDAMTELSVEIVLLFYRGINETVHGEWDASAYW